MDGVVMQGGGGGGGQTELCGIPLGEFWYCLPFLLAPNPPPPTQQCCNTVKTGDFNCLCSSISSPLLPSIGIDKSLFLALFGKCGLPSCPPA